MSFAKAKGTGRKMISAEQARGLVWAVVFLLAEEESESLHATVLLGTRGSAGLASSLGTLLAPTAPQDII